MGRTGRDIALKQFLNLLVWLRRVLIQDAAVLFAQRPDCALFQFPLFRNTQFRDFAALSTIIIARAEEDARTNIQNLPAHYARAVQGFMVSVRLTQEAAQEEHNRRMDIMQEQVTRMEGMLGVIAMTKGSRRTSKKGKGLSIHSSSSVPAEACHTETAAFHASNRYTPPSASTCSRRIPTCTRHSTLYSISTSSPLNLTFWTGYAHNQRHDAAVSAYHPTTTSNPDNGSSGTRRLHQPCTCCCAERSIGRAAPSAVLGGADDPFQGGKTAAAHLGVGIQPTSPILHLPTSFADH
jgi:hypothetical protein